LNLQRERPVALRGFGNGRAAHREIDPDHSGLGRKARLGLLAILRGAILPMLGLAAHGPPFSLAVVRHPGNRGLAALVARAVDAACMAPASFEDANWRPSVPSQTCESGGGANMIPSGDEQQAN